MSVDNSAPLVYTERQLNTSCHLAILSVVFDCTHLACSSSPPVCRPNPTEDKVPPQKSIKSQSQREKNCPAIFQRQGKEESLCETIAKKNWKGNWASYENSNKWLPTGEISIDVSAGSDSVKSIINRWEENTTCLSGALGDGRCSGWQCQSCAVLIINKKIHDWYTFTYRWGVSLYFHSLVFKPPDHLGFSITASLKWTLFGALFIPL